MTLTRHIIALFLITTSIFTIRAQEFTNYFTDYTLRVDYIFSNQNETSIIALDGMSKLPGWAGRRNNLSELPLKGNGQIYIYTADGSTCLYANSFSSLFQEWCVTEESAEVNRSFENTFLLPFPNQPIVVKIVLNDSQNRVTAQVEHLVDPTDILIQLKGNTPPTPHRYLIKNGDADNKIDIAILAEGYTKDEMETFYHDAQMACESLFAHEPFASMKDRFNVVAVASESKDSGVSIPHQGIWKQTAFGSHFDTFYSERYLTTNRVKSIHDALAGIDYEHIIILANTEQYGGGGIYNSFTLTTAHHPLFMPVVVHEFGHSFGGLADEYFYDNDVMTDTYPLAVEPWEQNITTLIEFDTKWKPLLKQGTPIPTPADQHEDYAIGVFEGGGYSAKGIYRPAFDCRMRTNTYPAFCPTCQHALQSLIDFYTK